MNKFHFLFLNLLISNLTFAGGGMSKALEATVETVDKHPRAVLAVGVLATCCAYKNGLNKAKPVQYQKGYALGSKEATEKLKKEFEEAWEEERHTYKVHPMNGSRLNERTVWGAQTTRFAKAVNLQGINM